MAAKKKNQGFIYEVPIVGVAPTEIKSPSLPLIIPPYEYATTTNPGIYRMPVVVERANYAAIAFAAYVVGAETVIGENRDLLLTDYSVSVQVHGGDPGRFRAVIFIGESTGAGIFRKNVCCSAASSSTITGQTGIVVKKGCKLRIDYEAQIAAGNYQVIVNLILVPFR